jgi:hypothetical protein
VGALERGGPHPRGHPALERGRPQPRWRPTLERGGPHPRGRPALKRGGPRPRGRLGQLFGWAAGATRVAIMLCVFWACKFVCVCVFLRKKICFPRFFKTHMAIPNTRLLIFFAFLSSVTTMYYVKSYTHRNPN